MGILILSVCAHLHASVEDRVFSGKPGGEIQRAHFRCLTFSQERPKAVLVLCPGQNGDGAIFFADDKWKSFAKAGNLALLIPCFVSDDEDLKSGRGYFVASRGSGKMLENALKQAGWGDLPLLLYGFSGGAHFTMSFADWAPKRILGFCSYSFGWWKPPPGDLHCPALIACGQYDGVRYGASFAYFQSGRRQGKPWSWVSLEGQEHEHSEKLDSFVRIYFQSLLGKGSKGRVTVDNVRKTPVTGGDPLMTSVLPSGKLVEPWRAIHHP